MRSQDIEFEHCCECSAHTGRAWRDEDSLYAGSRGPYCDACYGELPDKLAEECDDKDYQIERLKAKLAAAEADAERYRWLTEDHATNEVRHTLHLIVANIPTRIKTKTDAAIDAARGES